MRIRRFLRGRLFPCALLFLLAAGLFVALSVWLPRLLAPVAIVERAFSFAVALFTATADAPARRKTARLILLFLPWTGAIFCTVCPLPRTNPLPKTEGGGRLFERVAALTGGGTDAESLEYFPDGAAFRERFLSDLAGAKERIFLEYYILSLGSFWEEILQILEEKAEAGVDVRLIFDAFGCAMRLPPRYEKQLKRRGIAVKVFRPVVFGRRMGRRDHRKIAVIDDIAYTGGLNLADEYVEKRIRFGHWKDTAVRVTGNAADGFSALFLRTWGEDLPAPSRKNRNMGSDFCAIVADSADDAPRRAPVLFPLLAANAEQKLYLFTPYLAPDEELVAALAAAAGTGVDVRIMIPHIPDKRAVFFLTRAFARRLSLRGVSVREYTDGFLHAKSAVLDGRFGFVSSYNLDFRSMHIQAECGLFAEDEALSSALERDFLAAWESGTPLKKATFMRRVFERIALLFAPLV